jgi:citrate lyase subunit beta / citryl-CoA lyase
MPIVDPDLRRTWLFGPGADAHAHDAMRKSGADALIVDLEDFTPPARRDEARRGLISLLKQWRDASRITAVRINALDADGPTDLSAAMPAHPDIIAYPMAASAQQMHALHAALSHWEHTLGIAPNATEILPVCETALGVVEVRAIRRATAIVEAFEAARARGEDRALVDGLWVEVPTYRNAKRVIERARRLKQAMIDVGLHGDA